MCRTYLNPIPNSTRTGFWADLIRIPNRNQLIACNLSNSYLLLFFINIFFDMSITHSSETNHFYPHICDFLGFEVPDPDTRTGKLRKRIRLYALLWSTLTLYCSTRTWLPSRGRSTRPPSAFPTAWSMPLLRRYRMLFITLWNQYLYIL